MGEAHQVVVHQTKEVVVEVRQQLVLLEVVVQDKAEQEQQHQ